MAKRLKTLTLRQGKTPHTCAQQVTFDVFYRTLSKPAAINFPGKQPPTSSQCVQRRAELVTSVFVLCGEGEVRRMKPRDSKDCWKNRPQRDC